MEEESKKTLPLVFLGRPVASSRLTLSGSIVFRLPLCAAQFRSRSEASTRVPSDQVMSLFIVYLTVSGSSLVFSKVPNEGSGLSSPFSSTYHICLFIRY